jgi:formylglycine-generating enzyme required for sulfatase activity/dienelactone hydrolase
VTPPGARVFVRDYRDDRAGWRELGTAPIAYVMLQRGMKRWRIEAAGFDTLERAAGPGNHSFTLSKPGAAPEGMVEIPGGNATAWIAGMDPIERTSLAPYFIDRFEVTNRQFKQFVDGGGYSNRALWKVPFVRDGTPIPWEQGVALFVDATGRPGPSTWELGTFPSGQEDYPVSGISWYEAAAYAESVGKVLPSVVHWVRAASTGIPAFIISESNVGSSGLAPVGRYQGMSAWGLFDVAGNVREWLWNANGDERHILGGAWNDPSYMFSFAGSRPPLDRSAGNGFRCASYPSGAPAESLAPMPLAFRDFSREQPVPDAVHRAHLNIFEYDDLPLDARVESSEEAADWRLEVVSFAAAYGGERVPALIYFPKHARPPYQTVVYFPGSGAINQPSVRAAGWPSFLPQSGRVVVVPVYKGTWERNDGTESTWPSLTHRHKEAVIRQVQDFRRTVDYLATRSDLDLSTLAYFGNSWGGRMAAIIPAVDKRVRVTVALLGGLAAAHTFPEVDQINYITRVTTPVLMINGRHDAIEPLESAQLPMFRLWGTPAADRKHVVFDTGHGPFPQNPLRKEVLDFLDRYQGVPAVR